MSTFARFPQDHGDRRRVLLAGAAALVVVLLAMSAGILSSPRSSPAAGAVDWLARERPAGPVLTLGGWGGAVADDNPLRVLTADEEALGEAAVSSDPGSLVLPSGSTAIAEMLASGGWTITYRDSGATVLVRDGALPVEGAT